MKTAILLFLFMNLFVNDVKADAFLDLCYAKNTGKDQSEHIAWLKSNFGKKQCRNVHNEIKKVKSLTELIVPTIAIYLKAKKSWVQNFNYMYGFGDAEKLNSWPTLSYNPFLTGKGLDIYKDFKNIMHLSYTPEYQFTKNYTLCEAIKHFPHLKEITINSSELEKPSSDVCISERNIAVVIRNEFYGFKEIPQSIIIGFEDYRDNFANLINYPRVKYLGISQYLETQGSIKTLSQRMNISHLTLNLNGIQDIEKISKLINIRFLGIYCTKFSRSTIPDYSGESDFGCKKNHLTDITFLEEMTWLNYLNLESNKIKDIQVLKKLIHLEKVILNNNEISEVPDFSSLEKLNHLELRSNDLTNLNNLEKISNLNFLDVAENQIDDFDPIQRFNSLKYLNIARNSAQGIEKSLNIPETLKVLDISGSGVEVQGEFPQQQLELLAQEKIADITNYYQFLDRSSYITYGSTVPFINGDNFLKDYKNLEVLISRHNKLTRIPNISKSNKLKVLIAEYNEITDISVEIENDSILILDLSRNNLTAFPNLEKFRTLKNIDVIGNKIRSLDKLSFLPNPSRISLKNNQIKSIPFLDEKNFRETYFELDGNPLEKRSSYCPVDSTNYTVRDYCKN